MGAGSSHSTYNRGCDDTADDMNLPYLPEDIWIEILSYVSSEDLCKSCLYVCRQWKDLIVSHGVWKRKCLREGRVVPSFHWEKIPKNFYRKIYLYNPFGRNLVKNPHGEEGMKHWTVHSNGGDGWVVEQQPHGAEEVPQEVGSKSCFATSYGPCVKFQTISLLEEGFTKEILDICRPPFHVGEWHAARFDCGSKYTLIVALLDGNKEELLTYEFGPYMEEQWTGRSWSKASHVFSDYPPGVRYIAFEHSGQDSQFWAGHYGSKMTGAYVKCIPL